MELFSLNKSYGIFLCTFSMHINSRLFFDYFFQGGAKIRRHLVGALILFNFQYVTKGIFIHV